MTSDVASMLRQGDLLRPVAIEALEPVAAASRLRAFRRRQVVFTRGDPSDSLLVVLSGRVKVVVAPPTAAS